jgi:formyl-CoA transferase
VSHPDFGDFTLPGFPFRFSTVPPPDKLTAPDLGEHNEVVLSQYLGYDETRIAQLTAAGVLTRQQPEG